MINEYKSPFKLWRTVWDRVQFLLVLARGAAHCVRASEFPFGFGARRSFQARNATSGQQR
jgi:hypothetical protein